ncbi:MAG: hypothetical protein ABIQ01_01305 [Pseudolysinimonas sp.]
MKKTARDPVLPGDENSGFVVNPGFVVPSAVAQTRLRGGDTSSGLQSALDVRRHSRYPVRQIVQPAGSIRLWFDIGALSDDVTFARAGGPLAGCLLASSIFGHDASIPAGSHALSRR